MVTGTDNTQRTAAPLYDRLSRIVMHLQFAWWVGHVTTFTASSLYYLFYFANYSGVSYWAYYAALVGAAIAYPIALYKSLGSSVANLTDIQNVAKNDNTQYLLLSFLWMSQYPTLAALGPFAIFSGFHTTIYFTKTVVPVLLPSEATTQNSSKTSSIHISNSINKFVVNNYSNAVFIVAIWEIIFSPIWVLLQTILLQLNFFTPLFYGAFVFSRYYLSPGHRELFQSVTESVDHFVAENPKINANFREAYVGTRDKVTSMMNSPVDKTKVTTGK